MSIVNFNEFLNINGYYYNYNSIENFLLSLKVKHFVILTGKSGSGKSKLPQLLANYLIGANENIFYWIKVSTLKRSWTSNNKKDKHVGWTIYREYLEKVLPINMINGEYDAEIEGFKTKVKLSLMIQLYYDYNNESFKKYFKKLYDQEQLIKKEDEIFNRKHVQQMVDLGISYDSLKNIISNDYETKKEIILRPTLTKDVINGKGKVVPVEIFDYMPFNKYVPTMITINNLFSNAHFEVKIRMSGYGTDEIKNHLKKLYENNEKRFELKIKGFEHDFEDVISFNSKLFDHIKNYSLLPVGTDWTDGSHILGYYNVISDKYQHTTATQLIKRSKLDPKNPYFLILDEMNLSPVEKYFADFLSSIESGEEIPLYGNDDTLNLPKNLFIVGTINNSDETYKFLSKVLDRANIIELDSLNVHSYMSSKQIEINPVGDVNYLEYLLDDSNILNSNITNLKDILSEVYFNNENLWDILDRELSNLNYILNNTNFNFNFRVINEILRFMVVSWEYEGSPKEWKNWDRYFDVQIKQRILPKIYGYKKEIENILVDLLSFCLNECINNDLKSIKIIENNCKYYMSALKLKEMYLHGSQNNYVSFFI